MKIKKIARYFFAAAISIMLATVSGILSLTASAETVGAFDVTGGTLGVDYKYENNVLTILSDKKITIKNADPNTPTDQTIVVSKDISANITLDGVNIDVSGINNACAFKIEDGSDNEVVVNLAKDTKNYLKSGYWCAGLQKNGSGPLTVEGHGSLEVTGGAYAAGIGGGLNGDSSNITISSGTVIATGGKTGAGIGGGYMGDGSNITIDGGTVIAKGSDDGAGIGGGYMGDGSNITISGGTITATGGNAGAGIGGGYMGDGSAITISGGTVTADGGENGAAGIGGGYNGDGSAITISGGTVTATGGNAGAGIGGGYNGSGSNIIINSDINSAAVTATGRGDGAGIGGGHNGSGSNITISGGTITATGGNVGAGIGGGDNGDGSAITISGGSVKAVAGANANAIGGGMNKSAVTPKDEGNPVYLCVIENPNSETVTIGGISYTPNNHTAADSRDTNLYVYLTGETHIVMIGNDKMRYNFDSDKGEFEGKLVKGDREAPGLNDFDLVFIHNGDDIMAKIVTVLEGVEFSFNGIYWSTLETASILHNKMVTAYVRFAETDKLNASLAASKTAKSGHGEMFHHERVEPTCIAEGNIEYWECQSCCEYFLDKDGKTSTTLEGTVLANADNTNHLHISTDWSKDRAKHWHECLDCGKHFDEATHFSNAAATETQDEVCAVCGYVIFPAIGHIHSEHLAYVSEVAATCTKDGVKAHYICTCGKIFADANASREITSAEIAIPASGRHGATEIRNKVDPTNDSAGYTGDTVCIDCGEIITRGTVIPPIGGYKPSVTTSAATTTTTEPDEIEPDDDAEEDKDDVDDDKDDIEEDDDIDDNTTEEADDDESNDENDIAPSSDDDSEVSGEDDLNPPTGVTLSFAAMFIAGAAAAVSRKKRK